MSKVLIIYDSATGVQQLKAMLEGAGYDAVSAKFGEGGVAVAKAELPDVILMDIVMPELNGFQATWQLRPNDATKDIRVIVVSTKSEEIDRIGAMRQGAREYLVKPVEANC